MPLAKGYLFGLVNQSACSQYPDVDFDPPKNEKQAIKNAQLICWDCPIRWECLLYAYLMDTPNGIWGGATVEQRGLFSTLAGLSKQSTPDENLVKIHRLTSSTRK